LSVCTDAALLAINPGKCYAATSFLERDWEGVRRLRVYE
jgi:hypothetical protein